MTDPYKISLAKRLRYCRIFIWLKEAVRTGNWRPFFFILCRPREWFAYGSGLDC